MNYARIYYQIIEQRLNNPYDGYTENHHIVPQSLGGSDCKDNRVRLTAREHFLCHWLLVKMHQHDRRSYYKMLKGFNMMCNATSATHQRYRILSRTFAKYREDLSKAMSALQVGDKNSQAGTMWICNLVDQTNMKIPKGQIPSGWIAGRNKWKVKKPRQKTKEIGARKITTRKYHNGYKVSVDDIVYDSISQAADVLGLGHETARMRFKSNNFPQYIILPR